MDELINIVQYLQKIVNDTEGYVLFVKDTEGRYVYFNLYFEKFVGENFDNILYQTSDYVFRNNINRNQILYYIEEEKRIISGEMKRSVSVLRLIDKKGVPVYTQMLITAIYNKNGKVIGVMGRGADVTSYYEDELFHVHLHCKQLSMSEKEYLHYISQGLQPKEIAKVMDIQIETLYNFPSNISKKLKINDDTDRDIIYNKFIESYGRVMRSNFRS